MPKYLQIKKGKPEEFSSGINLSETFMENSNVNLTGFGIMETVSFHNQLVSKQRANNCGYISRGI